MSTSRVFLLSPVRMAGERAKLLASPRARFELAHRFQAGGAPIGELMSFVSGLYFRGKVSYARAFARPPTGRPGVLVIAPGVGFLDADAHITPADFAAQAAIEISAREPRFTGPLREASAALARDVGDHTEVVLLGSIATDKYVELLLETLGRRLLFPPDFVGRGDMSRGAMLLRAARAGVELPVEPLAGAIRRGARAPRLDAASGEPTAGKPAARKRRTPG